MPDENFKAVTNGFRLLPSFFEAIRPLADKERLMLYDAVWDFGFMRKEPETLPPLVNAAFVGIRENIRNSIEYYEKQRENGRKGGRPKTQTKPTQNPLETQPKPRVSKTENLDSESESDIESDIDSAGESANRAGEARDARTPPTVEDVASYITEHGLNADAQSFHDYYSARGWRDGSGRPFNDWTALLRRWASNGYDDRHKKNEESVMETLKKIYEEESAIVSVQDPQEQASITGPCDWFK